MARERAKVYRKPKEEHKRRFHGRVGTVKMANSRMVWLAFDTGEVECFDRDLIRRRVTTSG